MACVVKPGTAQHNGHLKHLAAEKPVEKPVEKEEKKSVKEEKKEK